MSVYANRTFRVGSAACPMTKQALAACARAYSFINRLNLTEA